MKLFPTKISERATLQTLGHQRVTVHCCPQMFTGRFNEFPASKFPVIEQIKSGPSGNIEILGKQNYLFPSGSVIKCFIFFRSISSTNFIRTVSYITSTNSGNNKCHRRDTTSPTHLRRTTIDTKHWKGHKRSKYLKSTKLNILLPFVTNISVAIVLNAFNKKSV